MSTSLLLLAVVVVVVVVVLLLLLLTASSPSPFLPARVSCFESASVPKEREGGLSAEHMAQVLAAVRGAAADEVSQGVARLPQFQ